MAPDTPPQQRREQTQSPKDPTSLDALDLESPSPVPPHTLKLSADNALRSPPSPPDTPLEERRRRLSGKRAPSPPPEEPPDVLLPTPPDGGWGWMVVFGSFLIHVIADGVAYSFGIFYVEFLEYFKAGRGPTGWIGSLMVGITWGSGPIASALTNKYGCRAVTIAGSVVASSGFILSIFAPNIWFMYFSFGIVGGIGLGLIYLPAIVSVTYYFEKRRAFATGLAVCGSGLGTFIFAPLTKILVETYTWKGAVLIEAGLLLNCIVCGSLFRPMEIQTVKKSEDLVAVEQNTEEQCLVNGGVAQGSEKSRVNGHVPTLVVQSDTEDEVTPVEQAMSAPVNMRLLAIKSEVTGSAHSLPFHGAHASEEQSSEGALLRRHASDNLLHKVHRRKRTTTCTSHKSADERESPAHKVRPMARKDIFYTSSLHNIPMYRSNPNMYTRSIMSLHDVSESVDSDLSGAALSGGAGGVARCSSCLPASMRCSPEMRETFQQMMDFRLLKNPLFLLFAISNLFTSIGFCVPYTFLPDRAILLGINENRAAFLIAVIGIANTIGRVVFGWLSDRPCVNRLWLYNAALTVCGVSTALSAFCRNYETLVMYAACFGCFIGVYVSITSVVLVDLLGLQVLISSFGLTLLFQGSAAIIGPPITGSTLTTLAMEMCDSVSPEGVYVSLTSVVLVDLLGLEALTSSFGLTLLFVGIAGVIGTPIAGWITDATGDYDTAFYIMGGVIALSGLMLFSIPCVRRYVEHREHVTQHDVDMGRKVTDETLVASADDVRRATPGVTYSESNVL